MDQMSKATADLMLDALIADAAHGLTGATVDLFTNTPDLSAVRVAADFDAPTFTGYAQATPAAWNKITDGDGGRAAAASVPVPFTPTVQAELPVIIQGAVILDAGGLLVHAAYFDEPITLTVANQPMHCSPKVPLHFQGDYVYESGLV